MNTSIMLQLLNTTGATKNELKSALGNSDEIITKEIEKLHVKRNMLRDILAELDKHIKEEEEEEFFAELFEDE